MTSATKRRLKRAIIQWELQWYAASAVTYLMAVPTLVFVFPDVSNLTVSMFILVSGLFNTVAATASAIKSSDTEE